MQDSSIIELFNRRSEQALSEMQKKYGKLCSQIAYNILNNNEDAEEAVNMAYEKVWEAIPPAQPKSLCGYLCATVRNTALNSSDKIRRHPCESFYDELGEIIPDSRTVETEYDSNQIGIYINTFLGKIKKKNRQIFVARYYYNMSVSDIAGSLGISESAVKTQLSRTRAKLRTYPEERGVEV